MRYFPRLSLFVLFALLITYAPLRAQVNKDTNLAQGKVITKDSLVKRDTLSKKDSLAKRDSVHVKVSKPVLDAKVEYHARDSIRLDAANRKMYLFGKASVKYQDLELRAAYIEITTDSNIAFARGVRDSGKMIGEPEFHQGSDVFNAETMRYNFKSKKGRINGIYTKEGEGYIHGEKVKKDSNNVMYMKNGTYTTCDLKYDPHFYIAAVRLKVIPHQEVITGPACLVIEGVPTPLAIPFGFFPLETGRHSGILIPSYGESQEQGFFLQNGGYYFGISDHVDMQLRGDIYSYGSWALKDIVTYDTRYKYSGSFNIDYALTKLPEENSSATTDTRNFFITWQHNQDPKANPNSVFMANVNAGGSSYYTYNSYNPSQFLSNTFQSNVTFTQNFPQTPFHLTIDGQHSQNTITKQIQITLPDVSFSVDRIYPAKWFEDNPSLYSSKWYNNISFSITSVASNRINTYDSLLLKPNTLKHMQNGASTNIPIAGNFHLLKYFTLSTAFNFSSIDYLQYNKERDLPSRITPTTDSVVVDTLQGFKMVNTYNASATLTTNVYGMYSLGTTGAIILRQVFYPSIGFSYHPDYSSSRYGYYGQYQTLEKTNVLYSEFQDGIYGGPGLGEQGAINFSLGSNLEMKVRVHTDSGTSYKKIVLLQRVSIGASYNMAADSFAWSGIALAANTTFFKKIAASFSGNIDPYRLRLNGSDTNSLAWTHGTIGHLTSMDLSLSTTLAPATKKPNKDVSTTNNSATTASPYAPLQFTAPDQYMNYTMMHPDFYAPVTIAPWSLSVFYNILYSQTLVPDQQPLTQSITFNGSAQVTKFWYASITSGFDLQSGQFTSTSISAKRDMHCWEMVFTAIPFGFHQSFTVNIHVKASVLQDLKLSRQRDWEDTQQIQQ